MASAAFVGQGCPQEMEARTPPGPNDVQPHPEDDKKFVEFSTYPAPTYVDNVPREDDDDEVFKEVPPEVRYISVPVSRACL